MGNVHSLIMPSSAAYIRHFYDYESGKQDKK